MVEGRGGLLAEIRTRGVDLVETAESPGRE